MKSRPRAMFQAALGTAGSLGLLAVAGWTAADTPPTEPRHTFTLAPIMATRSSGSSQPLHPAVRRVSAGTAGQVAIAR